MSTAAAQALQSTLDSSHLSLPSAKNNYLQQLNNDDDDDTTWSLNNNNNTDLHDPLVIAADVAAHISFLRKLKFQFLEHFAKDKYVKSIVSDIDDAPIVTADDNKRLADVNASKKDTLKQAKVVLDERYKDMARLAPLVEQDYNKACTSTAHATDISQKILDARLALTRLRQSHPHPRLTVPMATETLEEQTLAMQDLDDQVQAFSKQVSAAKERLRDAKRAVEHVRAERADVEKAAAISTERLGDDDSRLIPLYDWYTVATAVHQTLVSLLRWKAISENEIRLTYGIPTRHQTVNEITITLLFLPNTRRLAAARVQGLDPDLDISEIIDYHVQSDDVQGLISASLSCSRKL